MLRFDPLTPAASIDNAEPPPFDLVPQLRYDFSGTSLQLCDFLGTVAGEEMEWPIMQLPNDKNPEIFRGAMINDQIRF